MVLLIRGMFSESHISMSGIPISCHLQGVPFKAAEEQQDPMEGDYRARS